MEAHHNPVWSGKKAEVHLVTIRCQSRIFALAPLVYPQVVASVGRVLREHAESRQMFIWQGSQLLQFCQGQLRWTPKNYVDVAEVCKEKGWSPHLNGITEKVVGGMYCRHASQFLADTRHPSQAVLKHRAMTVSLVHEFGILFCKSSMDKERGREVHRVHECGAEARRRLPPPRKEREKSPARSRERGRDGDGSRDRSPTRQSRSR